MNSLIIRHIIPADDSGTECEPCRETSNYLHSMLEGLAPKLAGLDIQLSLQNLEVHTVSDANCGKLNYISFFGPELGLHAEQPIEEVLGASISFERCDGCKLPDGAPFEMRTLKTQEGAFQTIPPGVLSDALIRVVFSSLGSCGKGSCATCAGCGDQGE